MNDFATQLGADNSLDDTAKQIAAMMDDSGNFVDQPEPTQQKTATKTTESEAAKAAEPKESDSREAASAAAKTQASPQTSDEGSSDDTASDESAESADADDQGGEELTLETLAQKLGIEPSALMSAAKFRVKSEDFEGDATLAELVKSYQLEKYLNQKSMRLSDDQKALERQRGESESQVRERMQKLDAALRIAQKMFMGEFDGLDWEKMRREEPHNFQSKWVEYQARWAEMSQLSQALQDEHARIQQGLLAKHQEFTKEQQRLLATKLPEWNDEKVKKTDLDAMCQALIDVGATPDEAKSFLSNLADHRYVVLLRKAALYDKLKADAARVKKEVAAAPPIQKPGVKRAANAAQSDRDNQLNERFRKSGKVDDLAALLRARMD